MNVDENYARSASKAFIDPFIWFANSCNDFYFDRESEYFERDDIKEFNRKTTFSTIPKNVSPYLSF